MTRKHFEFLAESILESRGDFNELVARIIKLCKMSNDNFDEIKFIKACHSLNR